MVKLTKHRQRFDIHQMESQEQFQNLDSRTKEIASILFDQRVLITDSHDKLAEYVTRLLTSETERLHEKIDQLHRDLQLLGQANPGLERPVSPLPRQTSPRPQMSIFEAAAANDLKA